MTVRFAEQRPAVEGIDESRLARALDADDEVAGQPDAVGRDARGRPRKRSFGPWMGGAFRALARMKRLRGTPFDLFGYTAERRMERALIGWYEDLLERCAAAGGGGAQWAGILAAPMDIRGYGPVKEEAVSLVKAEVAAQLAALEAA